MDIQVWADFQCPYCMIGKKRLYKALEELGITDAQVSVRSFLLSPERAGADGKSMLKHVVDEYQTTEDKVEQNFKRLEEEGRELGLDMRISEGKTADAWDAHRLFQYAGTLGLGNRFFDRVQEAMFREGVVISSHDVLLRLADEAGLPASETREVLKDGSSFLDAVQADYGKALEMNIDYVPYYMSGGVYLFSGDLTLQQYKDGLRGLIPSGGA
jgi:predicted DsbA family dithiol-disulfide isomerase